jgi:phage-related protein
MVAENVTPAFQRKENYFVRKGLTPLEEPVITGMKLLGDVSLGNLVFNTRDADGVIWVCTDIENWWTLAEPDFPRVERSFGDGSYDVSGRYQAREMRLEGSILVPDPGMVRAARDTLAQALNLVYTGTWLKTVERQASKTAKIARVSRASNVTTATLSGVNPFIIGDSVTVACNETAFNGTFSVTGSTGLTITYASTGSNIAETLAIGSVQSGDSLTKAAFVRLGSQPEIEVISARGRIRFRADLTAADPIKYQWGSETDGYQVSTISPKNATLTGEYTVNNSGNAAVGGIITVNGPVTGPLTIENTTTNQKLTINTNLAGGSTTINVIKRSYFDGYATLTTQGPHGLYVGKTVTVAGVDTAFNGTHVITDVPTDSSFSYALNIPKSGTFTSYKLGETVSITNRVVASNIATLTTSAAHGLVTGVEVLMSGFTAGAVALNGRFEIQSTPTTTTFTVSVPALATLATGAATATAVTPIVTLNSSAQVTFVAGDSITVDNVATAVNVSATQILSVATDKLSLRYYANRSRPVRYKSYTASNSTSDDIITLTSWSPHGYRANDIVYVAGCGRPVNTTSAEIAVTVLAATTDTISFAVPSFNIGTASMSIAKASGKNYRVTVTTSAAHKFESGDVVRLRTPLRSGRVPVGINGDRSITKINATSYYYDVIPSSSTKTGLIEFFGAETGAVPISNGSKSSLASFENAPVNADGQTSTGGRMISFATIPLTNTTGSGNSEIIEETTSSGTVTGGADQLVINTSAQSVLLNNQAQYARGRLAAVTDWIKLVPGSNTLKVVDAGNAASTAVVTLKYRSGWLA